MDIKEEDFPLYQLLLKANRPGVEAAKDMFNKACKGGDDEKYSFALGIQTVALQVPVSSIPGCTEKTMKDTLRSCLAVFNDIASRGHTSGIFMVNYYKKNGYGV